jgi:hypothetical protein
MDTGETLWADLPVAERQRRKFLMEQSEQKRVEVTLPEVVVPGYEVPKEFLPKQPREVWELLESKGRQVAARHSRTVVRGTEYKSGPRKGEMRDTKTVDHYALATMDRRYPVIHAVWHDGKLSFARVHVVPSSATVYIDLITQVKKLIEEEHDAT